MRIHPCFPVGGEERLAALPASPPIEQVKFPSLVNPHAVTGVGWIKRTPKSGRIDGRRCQIERDSARKVHEGV